MERYIYIYICNSMSLSRIYSREIQNLLRVYIGLSIVGIWRECDCFLRFRNDRRFVFFFFFWRITNRGNNFPRVERGFFSFFFMILEYLQFCGLSIILEFL